MGTYSTTVLNGIALNSSGQNPVTITSTAYIGNTGSGRTSSVYGARTLSFNVYNFGRVATTQTFGNGQLANFQNGILLNGGGSIYNGASGLVTATGAGLQVSNPGGTIVNLGTAFAANPLGEFYSVQAPVGVGAIVSALLINGAAGETSALLEGNANGVDMDGNQQDGLLENFGVIDVAPDTYRPGYYGGGVPFGRGVAAYSGAYVMNYYGATIEGRVTGVVSGDGGTVANSGLISAARAGPNPGGVGIEFPNGGVVKNTSAGTISGVDFGVVSYNSIYGAVGGTIINAGTISATGTNGIAISLQVGGATVTNAGLISGAGGAIQFTGGGTNRLVVDPGATFQGVVSATGATTLELAAGNGSAGMLAALGSEYTGFSTIQFDPGAQWTLAGPADSFPSVITGFTVGDTIDLGGFIAVDKTFIGTGLVLADSVGGHATLGIKGDLSTDQFVLGSADGGTGTAITVQAEGTSVGSGLVGFVPRVSNDWNGAIIGTIVSVTNWNGGEFPSQDVGAEIGEGAAYAVTLSGGPPKPLPHVTGYGPGGQAYYDAANSLIIANGSSLTLQYPTEQGSTYPRGTITYYVIPQGNGGRPGLVLFDGSTDNGVSLNNAGELNINVGFVGIRGASIANSGVITVSSYLHLYGSGTGGATVTNSGLIDLNGPAFNSNTGGVAHLAISGMVTLDGGPGTQGLVMSTLIPPNTPGFEATIGNEITGGRDTGGVLVNNTTISGNGRIANTAIDQGYGFPLQLRNGPLGVIDGNNGYINPSNPPGLGAGQYTGRQPGALYINLQNEDKAVINQGLIEATGAAGLLIENTNVVNSYGGIGGTLAAFGYSSGSMGDVQLQLANAVVQGGTLDSSGTGIVIVTHGNDSVLDGSTAGSITNNGTLVIDNSVYTKAFGVIFNNGTIGLPTGATLEVGTGGLTLDGNGYVDLANFGMPDQSGGEITGSSPNDPDVLFNTYNTIEGSGRIGEDIHDTGFGLTNVVNGYGGSIVGSDPTHQLTVQLGSSQNALGTLVNHGLVQARSPGAPAGTTQATGIGFDIVDTLVTQIPSATLDAFGQDGIDGVSAANGIDAVAQLSFSKVVGGNVDALGFAEVNLYNSTLAGVTLTTSGAGVVQAMGGTSVFDGTNGAVINHGTVAVGAVLVNHTASGTGELSLLGTIVNSGVISVQDGTLSAGYSDVTLAGGGRITLVASAGSTLLGGPNSGTAPTLHNVDNTIAGAGMIGEVNASVNQAASLLDFDNQAAGIIDADDPNNPLALSAPVIANAGIIEATAGAGLEIGQYALPVTITNSGAGLVGAFGPGSHVDLSGGTIVGGLVTAGSGGIVQQFSGSNKLDGSTAAGPVTLAAPLLDERGGNGLTLVGTVLNTNTITIEQSVLNVGLGNLTLAGGGTVAMQFLPGYGLGSIGGSDPTTATTLFNVNNTIAGTGFIGGTGQMLTLNNEVGGLIDADSAGNSLSIVTGAQVTNAGTMVANGGTLTIADDVQNSGTIIATNGGTVNFAGAVNATPSGTVVIAGNGTVDDEQGFLLNLQFAGPGTFVDPAAQTVDGFARVTGFAQGDELDFTGLSFNAAFQPVVTHGSDAAGDFTTLYLTPDGNPADAPVSVLLAGTYAGGNFALNPDLGGGTQITYQTAPSTAPVLGPLMTNSDGTLVLDQVVDSQIQFNTIGGLGPEWEFEGQGNFLGDGQPGFLIRNVGDVDPGALDVGEVVGGQAAYTQIGGLGTEWQFQGNADFLGDGQTQFLIRNVGTVIGGALDLGEYKNGGITFTQIGGLGLEWEFEGTGDFLNDGHQGFLFRNVGDVDPGAVYVGEVSGGAAQFTQVGGLGTEWQFIGTGDFLGDGHTDFLIRNVGDVINGALDVGEVQNGQLTFTNIGGIGPEWEFVSTGNYIDTNKTDFLIRNTDADDGRLVVGSVVNGATQFTTVGGIGPEWNFHDSNVATRI